MSRSETYLAYLADWHAQHPAVVEPVRVQLFSPGGQEISRAFAASEQAVQSRVWNCNGAMNSRILASGECCEQWHDSRGVELYAVFPSREEHDAYSAPKSYREFYEQW